MCQAKNWTRIAALGALVLALALPAMAVSVAVTNYNWLELPAAQVTPFVGTSTGAGGNGYGSPASYRWGDWTWIPNRTFTGNGSADYYWAAIKLDTARLINNVIPQWWTGDGITLSKAYVDGSNDGVTWTEMGYNNFSSTPGARVRTTAWTSFAPGTYQYVRIRLNKGDFTSATSGYDYGGPGLIAIEPVGNGFLDSETQVNWANKPNFSTTATVSPGLGFGGTRFNDGYLYDDEGTRTGRNSGNWQMGDYAQLDLGTPRMIQKAMVIWDSGWTGSSYQVQYFDGTTWRNVNNMFSETYPGALGYTFDAVQAQLFRITGATGPEDYHLLNQVLLYAPEPASLMLLSLGGLVLLRRQRKPRT